MKVQVAEAKGLHGHGLSTGSKACVSTTTGVVDAAIQDAGIATLGQPLTCGMLLMRMQVELEMLVHIVWTAKGMAVHRLLAGKMQP